tara:strand:+ start:2492 stop:2863 length:372 start_codon:yes stop_codon:yes gene_type:complete
MMSQKALGKLVRMVREAKRLSYTDISSKELGVRFWQSVEGGEKLPTPLEIKRLIKTLEEKGTNGIKNDICESNDGYREAGSKDNMGSASVFSKGREKSGQSVRSERLEKGTGTHGVGQQGSGA